MYLHFQNTQFCLGCFYSWAYSSWYCYTLYPQHRINMFVQRAWKKTTCSLKMCNLLCLVLFSGFLMVVFYLDFFKFQAYYLEKIFPKLFCFEGSKMYSNSTNCWSFILVMEGVKYVSAHQEVIIYQKWFGSIWLLKFFCDQTLQNCDSCSVRWLMH